MAVGAPIRLRDPRRIHQAHDVLNLILNDEVPAPPSADLVELAIMRDVLCWVLNHAENAYFTEVIAVLDGWERTLGVIMKDENGANVPGFPSADSN